MIKIFRKVRQKLLIENKFTKYLMYALGEIVLVVAGILIALQLNTNKENRQNEKVELDYLKGIVTELDQDIYDLKDMVVRDSVHMQAYSNVLRAFTDVNLRNSKTFISAVGTANTYYAFKCNDIVFDDMKSSGRINFIQSDQLRQSILKYYKNAKHIQKSENENALPQIRKLSEDAFITNVDLNSFIEKHMFDSASGVELDDLDLTFFESSVNSDEVKSFGNRISMMKAIVRVNSTSHKIILDNAQRLKEGILGYLVSQGVEIKNSIPPQVIQAIKKGDVATLQRAIKKETLNECFVMEKESGNYLVHCITFKSLPALQFFVEEGADLESVCERKTPLMYAVKYGELEMVKFLVDKGADVHATNRGRTPLGYAIVYEHPEIAEYFKSIGVTE